MFYVVTLAITGFAVLFGALLTILLTAPPQCRANRLLGSGALRFFGRYSYGLYLFHGLLLFQLAKHVMSGASLPLFRGSALPGILAFTGVGVGLSVLLALASWHFWERPFLQLKRYFA
jgi:peptidoglycan/LPS O-acetylase OafA/YrhL